MRSNPLPSRIENAGGIVSTGVFVYAVVGGLTSNCRGLGVLGHHLPRAGITDDNASSNVSFNQVDT